MSRRIPVSLARCVAPASIEIPTDTNTIRQEISVQARLLTMGGLSAWVPKQNEYPNRLVNRPQSLDESYPTDTRTQTGVEALRKSEI
jgi:hypothetical protein